MKSTSKLWILAAVAVLTIVLLSPAALAQAKLPSPYERSAPGTVEFVIPDGVTSVTVEVYGAGGGGAGGGGGYLGNPESPIFFGGPGGAGGSGGYVSVTQQVSRTEWGQVLTVSVGQGGVGGSGGWFEWGEFIPMWHPPSAGTGGGQSSVSGPDWTVVAQGGAGGLLNEVPGADGEGYYEGQPGGLGGAGGDIGWDGLPGGHGYVKITYTTRAYGGGSLTVKLVKTDGADVDRIPVSVSGALSGAIHTNSAGVAKLSGLWAGAYTVNASTGGYTSNGPKSVVLRGNTSNESVTITLTPVPPDPPEPGPGAIEGKVVGGTTAATLPGVLVRLLDSTDTIIGLDMTDPAGEFSFAGLEPGSYGLRGSLDGYGTGTVVAAVVNDITTEVTLQLPAVTLVPPAPPATEPVVTPPDLPKTGAALAGMLVVSGLAVSAGVLVKRRGS